MNKETLLLDLENSTTTLFKTLATFSNEKFNQRPSGSGWSVAEIGEHLLLVEAACYHAIQEPGIDSTRSPDEKLSILKMVMEDYTSNYTSPNSFLPTATYHESTRLVNELQNQREQLKKAIINADITKASKMYKHPAFGTLTKWEWAYFAIYHGNRHLQQILALRS